jgi:dolichol-phosphate mannosyltransferase
LRLATDTWVSGWTLMFVVMLTIGGLQFIVLGVIGEYIGRIFLEVLNRPLYVVDYLMGANLKKITNDQKN